MSVLWLDCFEQDRSAASINRQYTAYGYPAEQVRFTEEVPNG